VTEFVGRRWWRSIAALERVSATASAATPPSRLSFGIDGSLLAITVTSAVLTALLVISPEMLAWGMVWVVLLALVLLPPQRAALQIAAVLVVSTVGAIAVFVIGDGNPAGEMPAASAISGWLLVAVTVALLGLVMYRISRSLHRRAVIAEGVARLGQRALTVSEPDELLSAALTVAVQVLHTEFGTALRRLPDGRLMVAAELGPESLPTGTIIPLAPSGSYALHVIDSGVPMASSDLRRDSRITPPTPLIDRGVVSGIAVPLLGTDGAVGVLAVHARRGRRYTVHEVAMLQAMATVVATAWEQVALRERLSHQALHDPLTGLPNRALLLDRLAQALSRRPSVRNSRERVAVSLIDLDDFKAVNDSLGHAAGDFVLKAVGQRLASAVRPSDTLARFGGDEFALICDSVPDEQAAVAIVNRLLAASSTPLAVEGAILTVTASAGVALTAGGRGPVTTAEALLREVDTALYRAKEHGGARAELFDVEMQLQAQARLTLEAELRLAIDRDELVMHYQPIRSAFDQHVIAVEALVRWSHPARGMLPPNVFLPLAEQTGLIVPLGQWVLRTACQQAADWQQGMFGAPGGPLRIAVNVSPRQLEDHELPQQVAQAIEATNLMPGTLWLELTETALLDESDAGHIALTRLVDAGATLVLDDFGTGYSSLTHLARFPIEALKIDRTFTAGLDKDQRDTAIVSAVIALGAELGVNVIAEGVETCDQLEILRRMGCPAVQGFLLDLPQSQPTWESRIGSLSAVRLPDEDGI